MQIYIYIYIYICIYTNKYVLRYMYVLCGLELVLFLFGACGSVAFAFKQWSETCSSITGFRRRGFDAA